MCSKILLGDISYAAAPLLSLLINHNPPRFHQRGGLMDKTFGYKILYTSIQNSVPVKK